MVSANYYCLGQTKSSRDSPHQNCLEKNFPHKRQDKWMLYTQELILLTVPDNGSQESRPGFIVEADDNSSLWKITEVLLSRHFASVRHKKMLVTIK